LSARPGLCGDFANYLLRRNIKYGRVVLAGSAVGKPAVERPAVETLLAVGRLVVEDLYLKACS
jgi:hypothetical protein